MNVLTSMEKVNGLSCQRSYIIIIICLLLRLLLEIPGPDARDLCSLSVKVHQAVADWTPKKVTAPIYETRFIKISLQVRNSRLTYIHMYRKDLVFRSPSQPRVLSRVMYHRYNIQATTRTLVGQRLLSSLFSKSHDSVKVILPMIIHISRGLRHAGYSDRHRQQNKRQSQNNNKKIGHMYKRYTICTKYTVREVYTVFSQCMLVVCLGVALKSDCLFLCHFSKYSMFGLPV